MGRKWLFFLIVIAALIAPCSASIIKKPPSKPVETSYASLECTEKDQANIHHIISTMAENGKLSLLFQQGSLREVGASINHVHPLKFLAVIFKSPYLKTCMGQIWNDYFKRNGFLDGLAPSLTREAETGRLHIYLRDFASDVGANVDHVKAYFDVRDWENLVLFLIQS